MSVEFNIGDLVVSKKELKIRHDGLCIPDVAFITWDTPQGYLDFSFTSLRCNEPCIVLGEFVDGALVVVSMHHSRLLVVKKANLLLLMPFSDTLVL